MTTRRAAWSAAAVVGLLVVMTVALRGQVPVDTSPARERTADGPASAAVVFVLFTASLAATAWAVIVRMRRRTAVPAAVAGRPDWLRADGGRPGWRIAPIAFVIVLAVLLIVMVLSRLGAAVPIDPPAPDGAAEAATRDPAGGVPPEPEPATPDGQWHLLGYFYVVTIAFLLILVVGAVVAARRRRRFSTVAPLATSDDQPVAAPADSGTLVRAAEVGLAEVGDLSREPRKAIIACYAAMEGELARVPEVIPQDFDTASEVLDRAVAGHALRPDSATELVDLFDEARFSSHVMTEAHREAAVGALRRVLDDLGSRV